MINQRITSEELNWVGIDFDNTICNNSGFPDFFPTTLIPGAKEGIEKIASQGYKPIIFTARPWSEFHIVKQFIETHSLPIKTIICGKPLMRCLIDDRNIAFDGSWEGIVDKIK